LKRAGLLSISVKPMSLVQNKGTTKKVHKARSLTAEQFQAFMVELKEPFGTLFLVCVCLGLRISEALALRWSDMDWLGSLVIVQRGIVNEIVDDVKTLSSEAGCEIAPELLERLRVWKQVSQFRGHEDDAECRCRPPTATALKHS
jgi:integrase